MCGIAGFVNLDGRPADGRVLSAMTATIAHRGPDDHGYLLASVRHDQAFSEEPRSSASPDLGIGFHRLTILDLSEHGHQPMLNGDRTIAIAFNGEIYNAFDFRTELEAAGYRFRSRTDTEVILYLYERYGLDGMLDRLNGMFAIVLADLRRREVHVVRDHLGIKPMYWAQVGHSVLFASEAKAFLSHPEFRASIDADHVDELLAFRYVAGDASILKGVHQLRAGHRLRIAGPAVSVTRYWSAPDVVSPAAITRIDAVNELEGILKCSVQSQLLSDVKVGCQLSGGIDSSLVTMFARTHFAANMDTFSVVFADPAFSEEPWINQVVASARAESHRFTFTEDTFLETLDAASWHMDQPLAHPNSLGIWLLAERARGDVTVLLSGEGADEVFGGYTRFYYAHLRSIMGPAAATVLGSPAVGGRIASHFSGDPVAAFINASRFMPSDVLSDVRPSSNHTPAMDRRRALFAEGQGSHLANCLKYEMQTYMVDLLVRQDKMTMAHSMENRVPFLDRNVVEFARRLSPSHLVAATLPTSTGRMRGTKVVVKELARRMFDDAFVFRRKSGFALPLAQYFGSPRFTSVMEDRLLPGMRSRGLVDVDAVRRLWARAVAGGAVTEPFWTVVALELFAQQFVDRRAH